jgi:acyl-CoA thioesterase I
MGFRGLGFLWAGVFATGSSAQAEGPLTVVLGDSLSAAYGMPREAGWVEQLALRVATGDDGARVVNASISGDTTAGGRARLPALLDELKPAAVVVFLGGNDGLRGIAPSATAANLEAMVSAARAAGAKVALIPVRLPPNYGEAFIRAFESVHEQSCAATGLPCLTFPWQDIALDARYMQSDGLHPNAEAQGLILEALWPQLCDWRGWAACGPTSDRQAAGGTSAVSGGTGSSSAGVDAAGEAP